MNRTLRMTAEQAVQLHQRAMDASSCGITIADANQPDFPLIYVNKSFEVITGYSADETLGKNCRFLQREDREQAGIPLIRDALYHAKDCLVTLKNYRKDGSLFWNELIISPVFNEAQQLTHFVGIQTDVTTRVIAQQSLETALKDLRETQMILIHAEKMNALGQMVAGIAHEINNPISFVNSNLYSLRHTLKTIFDAYQQLESLVLNDAQQLETAAQTIRQRADLNFLIADTEDLLQSSLDGLERVKNIVQELRTFARLDEAEYKFANLDDCVRSALLIASGELRNHIHVNLKLDNIPPIYCCPSELNQVFLNLIINAAQAITEKGEITIEGFDQDDHVRVVVSDTGCGMSQEVMDQIFTPFYTTKPPGKGVGLGLAITYKIITDRHKGEIYADSEIGKGSTFTLVLPKDLRR